MEMKMIKKMLYFELQIGRKVTFVLQQQITKLSVEFQMNFHVAFMTDRSQIKNERKLFRTQMLIKIVSN